MQIIHNTMKCKALKLNFNVIFDSNFIYYQNKILNTRIWNFICAARRCVSCSDFRLIWAPGHSITVWSGTTIRAMWQKYLHSSSRQNLWWMWLCVLRVIKYVHIVLFCQHVALIFRYVELTERFAENRSFVFGVTVSNFISTLWFLVAKPFPSSPSVNMFQATPIYSYVLCFIHSFMFILPVHWFQIAASKLQWSTKKFSIQILII